MDPVALATGQPLLVAAEGCPTTQRQLHTVLLAYALRSGGSGVGYAQSMNYLAGLLLLVTCRPELAFGLLAFGRRMLAWLLRALGLLAFRLDVWP